MRHVTQQGYRYGEMLSVFSFLNICLVALGKLWRRNATIWQKCKVKIAKKQVKVWLLDRFTLYLQILKYQITK
jgi:hypothetical protein